mmetsp:Transcript_109247/g.216977  ORF Transcript_109247/g.216977 Transcript_109247/m.216977 type:complete len:538 (+) Transcript_109247:70-1683(+)
MDRHYRWVPSHATHNQFHQGCQVTTLSINVDVEDAEWQVLPMRPSGFHSDHGRPPAACFTGNHLVLCRGAVFGVWPHMHEVPFGEEDDPSASNANIARLPEGMRPKRVLRFAAVSRQEAKDELVAIEVRPDGWLRGFGGGHAPGTIDLSAVRFGVDVGTPWVDEVTIHTCDFAAGTRIVLLQGCFSERAFKVHTQTLLAQLPLACRPESTQPFVVAGTRTSNFHLLLVQPKIGYGLGGEVIWADARWRWADGVNLSGIFFKAAAEVLEVPLELREWSGSRQLALVADFQNFVRSRCGSLQSAWQELFDQAGTGSIEFNEFNAGCRALGYLGNVSRVWTLLDSNQNGSITLEQLAVHVRERDLTGSLQAQFTEKRGPERGLQTKSLAPLLDKVVGAPDGSVARWTSLSRSCRDRPATVQLAGGRSSSARSVGRWQVHKTSQDSCDVPDWQRQTWAAESRNRWHSNNPKHQWHSASQQPWYQLTAAHIADPVRRLSPFSAAEIIDRRARHLTSDPTQRLSDPPPTGSGGKFAVVASSTW